MTTFQNDLIRYAASQPHDPVYEPLFRLVDTLKTQFTALEETLREGNFVDATKANGAYYWGDCKHYLGQVPLHMFMESRYFFATPDDKKHFLKRLSEDCFLAMNNLDELRGHIDTLPIGGPLPDTEEGRALQPLMGPLHTQQAQEDIHRLKNTLRSLARCADRSSVGLKSEPMGPRQPG